MDKLKLDYRKVIAASFILLSLVLGLIFFMHVSFPDSLGGYFESRYYKQYGPVAICVELFIAGYYLFKGTKKANFALALFAFTALLDIIFNLTGLFISGVPLYGMVLFFLCAIISLMIAFSNAFDLGKITVLGTIGSFIISNAIEFYFNYS